MSSRRKLFGLVLALSSMGASATGCSSSSTNYGTGNPDSGTGSGNGNDSGGGQTDSSSFGGQDSGSSVNDSSTSGNDTSTTVADSGSTAADGSTPDTGTPLGDASNKDTGPLADTGTKDSATGNDASADASGTCPDNTAFTPFTWAPPTAFHQNKCTAAQGAAYNTSLMGNGPFTSGSATCDACIQTDEAATMHGPIVTVMGNPQELNIGGCIANESGLAADKAAGGCGNQVNNANDCIGQQCDDCADSSNPTPGGAFDTCDQAVLAAGAICAADSVTMACSTELNMDGGVQTCLNDTLVQYITLWCGP